VNGEYLVPATVGHDWNDSLTVEVTHAWDSWKSAQCWRQIIL
jgi:hypothetical protein